MTSAKHPAFYSAEFRAEAVRLARTSEKPYTQIARDNFLVTNTRSSPQDSLVALSCYSGFIM